MRGKGKGVKKAVIVKFKGKHSHNHSNVEQLKEEIRQKVTAAREQRNKNSSQNNLTNFQNYTEFYQYENRMTSRPSKMVESPSNDLLGKRAVYKDNDEKENKEKVSSLKMTQKKPSDNSKKTVYFGNNPLIYKKSERNVDKNKKQNDLNLSSTKNKLSEKENNKKFNNKSMLNFNDKFFSKNNESDSESESAVNENTQKFQLNSATKKTIAKSAVRLNIKQNYNQGDNLKKSKIKIQKIKEPSLKINQNEDEKEVSKSPIQQEQKEIIKKPVEIEKKDIAKLPESPKVKEIVKQEKKNNDKYEEKEKLNQMKESNIEEDQNNQIKIEEMKNSITQLKKGELKLEDKINNKDLDFNAKELNINENYKNLNENKENNDINEKIIDNNKEIIDDNNYENQNLEIDKKLAFSRNKYHNENINNNQNLDDINQKFTHKSINSNNSPERIPKKDTNKKNQKAYSNFIQNIKKANKKKKNEKLTNLLKFEDPRVKRDEPKARLSRAIKKIKLLNRTMLHSYKGINTKEKDLSKSINNNQTLKNLSEKDIFNTREEVSYRKQNLSCKNIKENNNNISNNFSGIIIIKYEDGEKMFESKLEGDLDEINEILKRQNIEINDKEIELVYKEDLENLKHGNERIEEEYFKLRDKYDKQKDLLDHYKNLNENYNNQSELLNSYQKEKKEFEKQKELIDQYEDERREYLKQKELLNQYENERKEYIKQKELLNQYENERKERDNMENSLKVSIRKKAKEKQNIQMEEDKLKMKEIKDRIQKYKDELNKGNATDNLRMSCRTKILKKATFNFDRLRESNHQKLIQLQEIEEEKENKFELTEKDNEDLNDSIPNIKEHKLVNNNNISTINANFNKSPVNNNINNNDKNNNQEKRLEFKFPRDNNISNESEKKENKEKNKYSRAMDRLKKRYQKSEDGFKSKKSEKINEMAKRLENVMGKPQSNEIREKIDNPEIVREGKTAEILQSQTLSVKKVKKPHRPQKFL